MRSEERLSIVLHRGVWRTTSTSQLFVRVVRLGGRPTITLIRLRRIPTCPRWATSPIGWLLLHGSKPATRLAMGPLLFSPWSATRPARWLPCGSRPRRGMLLPLLTCLRALRPTGYEHGASYGGYLATGLNSSMVDDDEAASRAEYRYQEQVQRQASRTPAYGDPYGCPRPNARSSSLRTSFDGREGESQSSQVFQRMEGIMARMEQHLAASTPAPATSSATHSAPFYSGEFHSFIFTLNC
jgi:hypothetical protein